MTAEIGRGSRLMCLESLEMCGVTLASTGTILTCAEIRDNSVWAFCCAHAQPSIQCGAGVVSLEELSANSHPDSMIDSCGRPMWCARLFSVIGPGAPEFAERLLERPLELAPEGGFGIVPTRAPAWEPA